MKKHLRTAVLVTAALLILTALTGCALLERFLPGSDRGESRTEAALQQQAVLGTYHVETDADSNVSMTANVTIPDYSAYIPLFIAEAEENAEDEEDFEKQLYKLLLEAVESGEPMQTAEHRITLDLTALDPEKAQVDWMYEELIEAAQNAAFDAEIEEYCLALLASTFPDTYGAEFTAESEVPAE